MCRARLLPGRQFGALGSSELGKGQMPRDTIVNFLTPLGRGGVGVAVGDWEQGASLGVLSIALLASAQA